MQASSNQDSAGQPLPPPPGPEVRKSQARVPKGLPGAGRFAPRHPEEPAPYGPARRTQVGARVHSTPVRKSRESFGTEFGTGESKVRAASEIAEDRYSVPQHAKLTPNATDLFYQGRRAPSDDLDHFRDDSYHRERMASIARAADDAYNAIVDKANADLVAKLKAELKQESDELQAARAAEYELKVAEVNQKLKDGLEQKLETRIAQRKLQETTDQASALLEHAKRREAEAEASRTAALRDAEEARNQLENLKERGNSQEGVGTMLSDHGSAYQQELALLEIAEMERAAGEQLRPKIVETPARASARTPDGRARFVHTDYTGSFTNDIRLTHTPLREHVEWPPVKQQLSQQSEKLPPLPLNTQRFAVGTPETGDGRASGTAEEPSRGHGAADWPEDEPKEREREYRDGGYRDKSKPWEPGKANVKLSNFKFADAKTGNPARLVKWLDEFENFVDMRWPDGGLEVFEKIQAHVEEQHAMYLQLSVQDRAMAGCALVALRPTPDRICRAIFIEVVGKFPEEVKSSAELTIDFRNKRRLTLTDLFFQLRVMAYPQSTEGQLAEKEIMRAYFNIAKDGLFDYLRDWRELMDKFMAPSVRVISEMDDFSEYYLVLKTTVKRANPGREWMFMYMQKTLGGEMEEPTGRVGMEFTFRYWDLVFMLTRLCYPPLLGKHQASPLTQEKAKRYTPPLRAHWALEGKYEDEEDWDADWDGFTLPDGQCWPPDTEEPTEEPEAYWAKGGAKGAAKKGSGPTKPCCLNSACPKTKVPGECISKAKDLTCTKCKKTGHSKEACWNSHPEALMPQFLLDRQKKNGKGGNGKRKQGKGGAKPAKANAVKIDEAANVTHSDIANLQQEVNRLNHFGDLAGSAGDAEEP